MLAVGAAFGAGAAGALASFTVKGGVAVGLAAGVAGLALTAGSAVGIATRLVVGRLADRRVGRHLRVVAAMTLGGALGVTLFALGVPWVYLLATAIAFGFGWGWPGLFNLAVVEHNPNAPAAATGITQTGTNVGAVFGPLAFGLLVDAWGWSGAWLMAAVWFVSSAAAMLGGRVLLRKYSAVSAARREREAGADLR
jgi:MFS family permease